MKRIKCGTLLIALAISMSFSSCLLDDPAVLDGTGTVGETLSESAPDTEPDTSSGTADTEPDTEPETMPDTEPVSAPETAPGTEPVTAPETESETTPGTAPVTSAPETKPETSAPETKPETSAPPTHTHAYTTKVVAPTCTAGGYTVHTCSCGANYTDSKTAALGHSWDGGTVTKAATTSAEGIKTFTCVRCHATRTESIPKISIWEQTATADKDVLVAQRVMYYLNLYREQQGDAKASELTGKGKQYAKIRSEQITTNYAHDYKDKHAASGQLEYGEYKDATLFGDPPENSYWEAPCGEAIAATIFWDANIDTIAYSIAGSIKNSYDHWCYVGSSAEYPYMAVGCTLGADGYWYCAIELSDTLQYE